MKSDYTVYDYFLMMSLISFLGFLLENIWISVRKGYVDNRNMNLPFLLGYGIAVMFIYFVLGVPDKSNAFLYCVICFIIVSLGEILLGTVVEKICGIHYWDYTSLPLHFTRYTSLFTSIGFSLIITVQCYPDNSSLHRLLGKLLLYVQASGLSSLMGT